MKKKIFSFVIILIVINVCCSSPTEPNGDGGVSWKLGNVIHGSSPNGKWRTVTFTNGNGFRIYNVFAVFSYRGKNENQLKIAETMSSKAQRTLWAYYDSRGNRPEINKVIYSKGP